MHAEIPPLCQSAVAGERFPKVGVENFFVASLKTFPRFCSYKKINSTFSVLSFSIYSELLHPAGRGKANSVRVLEGKRRVHLHIFASY